MGIGKIQTEAELQRQVDRRMAEFFDVTPSHRIPGLTAGDFTAPTLLNGWANSGGVFQTAGYLIDRFGFVHLRGSVTGGTPSSTIFNLPVGFRPSEMEQFSVVAFSAGVQALTLVNVKAGGNVDGAANNERVSLAGITFRAEG